jgi:uncharacterized membrane protein YuzA (DUF378 family)
VQKVIIKIKINNNIIGIFSFQLMMHLEGRENKKFANYALAMSMCFVSLQDQS